MYEVLYSAWLSENENAELQDLPEDFYAKLADYIKHIRQEERMLDRKSAKARLIIKEYEIAKRLMRELATLRFNKIIAHMASAKSLKKDALTLEEGTILLGLRPHFEEFRSFLKDSLRGKAAKIPTEGAELPKKKLLRFLQEVPAVVGADLKIYGPFSVQDVATLPNENARVLVKHGVAVEIDTA
ncbi:MAG: hypothetical protein ACFFB3_23595 [Candidatus Hodarchaeota archaeon]